DSLEVRTAYGDQKIPLRQIGLARKQPNGSFKIQARGLNATGDLVARNLELNTALGPLRVDTEDLRTISVANGTLKLVDEGTAALWWFPDTAQSTCRDSVKGRAFTLPDYELVSDPAGGLVLAAKKAAALGSVPCDDDIDFTEQDYTLEVRFKLL